VDALTTADRHATAPGPVVRGGTGQISVTAAAGTRVTAEGAGGRAEGTVDSFGDLLARLGITDLLRGQGGWIGFDLAPGTYQVHTSGDAGDQHHHVQVLGPEELPADYSERVLGQRLAAGFGYLEVRDGTQLSVNVGLPDPERWGPGPYPTLVQYSGYCPSRPDFLTGDPQLDTGMNTEANVCRHLGYAVVGVNMRGSGASGGAWDLLSDQAAIDGYDAIEAVAHQDWARPHPSGHRSVGMIGRSMPGLSQLLVASTGPPSLRAITPAAVTGRPFDTGQPGGIPNTWLLGTVRFWEVEPPPAQPGALDRGSRYEVWDDWIAGRIARGDLVCAQNQLLRGHNNDILTQGPRHRPHITCETWTPTITAPTLLMGAWQDQDSGSGFANLPASFPASTPVRILFTNGTHEESRFPALMAEWLQFLAVHVAGRSPQISHEAQEYLDQRYVAMFPGGLPIPASPLAHVAEARLDEALAQRPLATVLLELGAGAHRAPGYPYPSTRVLFDSWPPEREAQPWYLGPGGTLTTAAPKNEAAPSSYRYDPRSKAPTTNPQQLDLNQLRPKVVWGHPAAGCSAGFVSEPLEAPTLIVGPCSADLWLSTDAPDVDLEVTLSEVRPDGWETYVQGGWLRSSARALDEEQSTPLQPWPATGPAEALEPGHEVYVRVGILPVAHLFRAGSRIRLGIEAPGGNQPSWTFDALWPDGTAGGEAVVVNVHHDPEHPSRLVLPVAAGAEPAGGWPPLPPPGVLRNQPSRRSRPSPT
jgi:hypothetical protein